MALLRNFIVPNFENYTEKKCGKRNRQLVTLIKILHKFTILGHGQYFQ